MFSGTTFKTLSYFWRENCRFKGLFFATSFSWLGGMVLQKLILALIAARILDKLVAEYNNHSTNYWPAFIPDIIAFIIVAILGLALVNGGLVLLSKLETRVRPIIQAQLFDRLTGHSMQFHADTFSGSLVTQVNRFTAAYISLTDTFIIVILRLVTNVFIATAIIAFFAPPIALAMLAWTICFTALNLWLVKKRIHLSKLAAAADSVLTGHLADSMGNIGTVKAFAGEARELDTHTGMAKDRAFKKYRSWIRSIKNDLVLGLLMTVLQLATLLLSVHAVMTGSMSIGTLLLIQVYVTQIITELWGLSGISRNLEQNFSDAAEMTELLDHPITVTDPAQPERVRISDGAINFDHIAFTHGDTKKDDALFTDFSLQIAPGEKVGLVGHSGSGKTTLTKLLLRFADIDEGAIRIDGQDIRAIRQSDLRGHIGYVPQEPALFHRTLGENIAYGKPSASKAEIIAAAKKAHAHEFISKLPKGYDTMVGERGIKLSGGQRQRIAIARAILKNAPILVLDEATSALDSESERLIQNALTDFMKDRTTLVIAHRLSTVQKMDRIVVLDNGVIVEQGTHAELVSRKGAYAELWAHQSGGFIDD